MCGGKTCSRCTGRTDNQLGHIYGNLQNLDFDNPKLNNLCQKFDELPFKFEKINEINLSEDVLDEKFAQEVRKFIKSVPFLERPLSNNSDNLPESKVFASTYNFKEVIEAVDKPNKHYNAWYWERYNENFYRLTPKTLAAFVGSPIKKLIGLVEAKLRATFLLADYAKSTWVIQRIVEGKYMGAHLDNGYGRKFSFIYYLTDGWSDKDGGELVVFNDEVNCMGINCRLLANQEIEGDCVKISPNFNRLVCWELNNPNWPVHYVNKSERGDRFALVGFFVKL